MRSIEVIATAALTIQPKRGQTNRGGTSAPLDEMLGRLEVAGWLCHWQGEMIEQECGTHGRCR